MCIKKIHIIPFEPLRHAMAELFKFWRGNYWDVDSNPDTYILEQYNDF